MESDVGLRRGWRVRQRRLKRWKIVGYVALWVVAVLFTYWLNVTVGEQTTSEALLRTALYWAAFWVVWFTATWIRAVWARRQPNT